MNTTPPHRLTDSAGQPWAGRLLRPNPFAGDDGSTPAPLRAALDTTDPDERLQAVAEVLGGVRVLVPVVAHAHPGRTADGAVAAHDPHGSGDPQADACASAAMVSVQTPDGRAALPIFSSVEQCHAWRPDCRPVPVEGGRAALAAVSDADSLLVLDAAAAQPVLLGRPAVWAIAQGRTWLPSWADPQLPEIAARALRGITEVRGIRLERGDSSELRAVLAIRPGLAREQVEMVVAQAQHALSRDAEITDRVDSLELYPVAIAE